MKTSAPVSPADLAGVTTYPTLGKALAAIAQTSHDLHVKHLAKKPATKVKRHGK
jgi:hypothetical protein